MPAQTSREQKRCIKEKEKGRRITAGVLIYSRRLEEEVTVCFVVLSHRAGRGCAFPFLEWDIYLVTSQGYSWASHLGLHEGRGPSLKELPCHLPAKQRQEVRPVKLN